MDRFIGDLRLHTHDLKGGRLGFGGVTVRYSPRRHHDDDDVLRCDRYLLVHWKNFAKALRAHDEREEQKPPADRRRTWHGEVWELANIELSERLRALLGSMLSTRKDVGTLTLDNNDFGSDGVNFLCDIVEKNPHLKRMTLRNNPIEDVGDVTRLCKAVSRHTSMEEITLENAGLDGDEGLLSIILDASGNLESLNLSGNGLGSRAAAEIITRFLANGRTRRMILRESNLGDDSADLFAALLRGNTDLRLLDIRANRFTSSGMRAIKNVLFDTSSLNAAVGSNHTCTVHVDEAEPEDKLGAINFHGAEPKDEQGAINFHGASADQNLHRKVFSLLYATTDGVKLSRLLDGVPLGLMPDVLRYFQDYYVSDIPRGMRKHVMESLRDYTADDFEGEFSRQTMFTAVFEVLRSWNLPLLYEN